MKKIIVIIVVFLSILDSMKMFAQSQATVPAYHWAYSYLQQLRIRGYLVGLNNIQAPFTQEQVINNLIHLNKQIQQGNIKSTSQDQWLIDYLVKEFQTIENTNSDHNSLLIQPGIWADEQIQHIDNETKFYTQLRSQLGFSLGKSLCLYNGIRLDQSLLDDPDYIGEKWRGFAGYTEQAYLRFTNYDLPITNFSFGFTLGRDFLRWGSGKTGRLLFSNYAQPLDMLSLSFRYKGLLFTALAADLDHWMLADSLVQEYHTQKANRFLSAHRLTFNFYNKLQVGLTEALLYGGPNSNWELKYHNPLLYYHGELLNGGGDDGNGLLYLDFDWYPWRNWEFYGEFLVDDLQLEKTVTGDLEPNEIGMIFGFQHSDLLGLNGSLLGLEYVRIANRTYNSSKDWEKFIHFNQPIGYSLGNNFDRWNLTANYWVMRGWQIGVLFDYIRKGEGSILDPWDTPWIKYSLSEGYDEPFPYGVVERSLIANFNLKIHFSMNAIFECQFSYQNTDNKFHQSGRNENNWSLFFKFHWDVTRNLFY